MVLKIREGELGPGADAPVTVAVVDYIDRRAVQEGVVLVEVGRAPQRRQDLAVLTVLKVESHRAESEETAARQRKK